MSHARSIQVGPYISREKGTQGPYFSRFVAGIMREFQRVLQKITWYVVAMK
jgi:hypothetical protein